MSGLRLLPCGALLSLAIAVSGCGMQSSSLPAMAQTSVLRALNQTGAGKISHIVYIVQENRSFNDMFMGYPGAYTVSKGKTSTGKMVALKPVSLTALYDIDHSAGAMFTACDGTGKLPGTKCRMDAFDKERAFGGPKEYPQYVYVPHNESKPYWDMAHQWVLADNMFQSQLDESFIAHQYIIAAQAAWSVNLPTGAWGCEGGSYDEISTVTTSRDLNGPKTRPCYDYETLGDELDKAHLSWRFYAAAYGTASSGDGSFWSSYQAVDHIYNGPDWKNVISPNWKFITDVRHGKLANFTWITPVCDDSDHVNCAGGFGPSWVAALVNTVGKSKFWDSTAIFVQWDDWGGLYDPVKPPYENRDSLGFRVPLLVISPYARDDRVSHVQYETASVLRFAEDLWGLGQMAPADKRANSPASDCFNFAQKARTFVPIKAPEPPSFFVHQNDAQNYFAPDYE